MISCAQEIKNEKYQISFAAYLQNQDSYKFYNYKPLF